MEREKRQGLKNRNCTGIGSRMKSADEQADRGKNMKNIEGKPFLSVPFVVA